MHMYLLLLWFFYARAADEISRYCHCTPTPVASNSWHARLKEPPTTM